MTTPARILVVEDEQDIADVLLDYLRHAGYAPEHAADGRTALQVLTAPQPPDLTLLDVMLPGIDGLEVLRRIRADQRTALLPVVVLTTSREPLDLAQAYRLGANSYIRKPVDFDRFERAIGLIGHYWLELNETTETVARGAY